MLHLARDGVFSRGGVRGAYPSQLRAGSHPTWSINQLRICTGVQLCRALVQQPTAAVAACAVGCWQLALGVVVGEPSGCVAVCSLAVCRSVQAPTSPVHAGLLRFFATYPGLFVCWLVGWMHYVLGSGLQSLCRFCFAVSDESAGPNMYEGQHVKQLHDSMWLRQRTRHVLVGAHIV